MKRLFSLIALVCMCCTAFAQNRVTGKISSSEDGAGIPYADVMVKGSMNGSSADANGNYSIGDVPNGAVLLFSSIGYKDQEIAVDGRSVINVTLQAATESLDEGIVVAYGTVRKGTYTGAASVVGKDDIKDLPSVSFEAALNGKVAGLQMTQTSGQAGSAPSIRIRGIGSMNASNEPLYVIDGVPANSGDMGQMSSYTYSTNNAMSLLNPSDIESITVLKDAAASALYGSRAANGVILVTTKRGREGRPVVTLKTSVGLTPSWAVDNYEPAGIQENVNMLYMVLHDYRTSSGRTEEAASEYAIGQLNSRWNRFGYDLSVNGPGVYENVNITDRTDGKIVRNGDFFDWDDAYFRTAVYQTYDLGVSGGTGNTSYYTSLAYTKEQGRVYTNEFDRISGRVNLNTKVGNRLSLKTNLSLASTGRSGYNDTRSTASNYFMQTRNLLWGLYWPDDYKTGEPWTDRYQSLAQNLLYYNDLWENTSKTVKISASETATFKLTEWLNLSSLFSYDLSNTRDHIWYSAEHFNGASVNGSVDEMNTNTSKVLSSTTMNLNKSFGDHTFGALVGFEAERNNTDFMRASGEDLPVTTLQTVSTAGILDANAYSWGNAMMSILSRLEYNYADRYYLSGSYRRDGSSKLGPNTRWGNFWSVAGSWRISQEAFMADQDVISNLKLRASYGVNGTLPTNNYGWRSLTGYGNKYMSSPGGSLSNAADADLSWETSYTSNLALEFGLLNERITGTVEYFNRDSRDLLQDVPISTITGFSSTLQNVGEINNHGWEIELAADIIRTRDLTWSIGANASLLKSRVTKLYDGQDIIWSDPTGDDDRADFIYREGESTLAFYGYEWAGVNPENGAQWYYSNNDQSDDTLNGRNVVYDFNDADRIVLGSATPKVYGGINTNLDWKGFSLGLNFAYKIGGYLYDGAEKDVADDGYYWNRIRSKYYYDNMWTESNKSGTQPKLRGTDLEDAMQASSRHMYNASFLRLKTISLGYSIPRELVSKVGLSGARVYFNGGNLLTFSKYKIADPEVNEYGTRGWETPIGKTYTFGLELNF